MADTKNKGDILEDVVALIYSAPELEIQTRVKLKWLSDPKIYNQIDVLITGEFAGYSNKIAIECKNEKKKVSISDAHDFKGKLDNVGIPPSQGIFVSVNGYTKPAQSFLKKHQIKTFVLTGLTEDRLSKAVYDCIQSHIFVIGQWSSISELPILPVSAQPHPDWVQVYIDCEDMPHHLVLIDHVWSLWANEKIPLSLGEVFIYFNYSNGGGAIFTLNVFGMVGILTGKYSKFTIHDTQSALPDRGIVEPTFPKSFCIENLIKITDENELQNYIKSKAAFETIKTRVPRIMGDKYYWPPSKQAVHTILSMQAKGEDITFSKVEGHDLDEAWRKADANFRSAILSAKR